MSPLIEYAKKGLKNCYMADTQCWSYIYHLDGRESPNESFPAQDSFYSLNVILGLAALGKAAWEKDYDLPELLQINARRIFKYKAPTYAIGMALWASACLQTPLEKDITEQIHSFITNRKNWKNFRAQDLGMILTGISEQKISGNSEYDTLAPDLFSFLKARYVSKSNLFYDAAKGFRRHFSSFATQTYLTTACYHYAQAYNNEDAFSIADKAVEKLLTLQGPNAEWPWFYCTLRGLVVDNYEIYSVHQNGMAALFLNFAEARNIPGSRAALLKGFDWIFENNPLKKNMMRPDLGMFYRSIARKGELDNKIKRLIRSLIHALLGRGDDDALPENLTLRQECRSYELGWILYSFGTRNDIREITHHPAFENIKSDLRTGPLMS